MKFRKFLLPFILVFSTFAVAQEFTYNVPPGYSVPSNFIHLDLSYKLKGINVEKEYSKEYLRVLKDIPESELKNTPDDYQAYVKQGRKYIASLSSKVRNIFTEDELWYIYAFDLKLKNKIKKIK